MNGNIDGNFQIAPLPQGNYFNCSNPIEGIYGEFELFGALNELHLLPDSFVTLIGMNSFIDDYNINILFISDNFTNIKPSVQNITQGFDDLSLYFGVDYLIMNAKWTLQIQIDTRDDYGRIFINEIDIAVAGTAEVEIELIDNVSNVYIDPPVYHIFFCNNQTNFEEIQFIDSITKQPYNINDYVLSDSGNRYQVAFNDIGENFNSVSLHFIDSNESPSQTPSQFANPTLSLSESSTSTLSINPTVPSSNSPTTTQTIGATASPTTTSTISPTTTLSVGATASPTSTLTMSPTTTLIVGASTSTTPVIFPDFTFSPSTLTETNSGTPTRSKSMIFNILPPIIASQSSSKSLLRTTISRATISSISTNPMEQNICSERCDTGHEEVDLNLENIVSSNSTIELLSTNGDVDGILIIPNHIVSEPNAMLSVSFVTGTNSFLSNGLLLGNTIADITIIDTSGSSITNLDNPLTICFSQPEGELDVCFFLLYNIINFFLISIIFTIE